MPGSWLVAHGSRLASRPEISMIWRGAAPYKDHLLCRTGRDLDGLLEEHREEAEALVTDSDWSGFDYLAVVCVDESEDRVVGVTSLAGDDELLFLVVPDRQGEGIGHLMVEALLPEVDDATEEDVLSGGWGPPYRAVAGSEEGASFLHSLTSRFGWKAFALIWWSGFEDEKLEWRNVLEREKGLHPRVLPPLGLDGAYWEAKIYSWPDGSDAIVRIDVGYQDEVFLVVRWIDLPSTWQDPTTGEDDFPEFAIDLPHEAGGHQWVTLSDARRFPEALERKLVGLFLDLGIERPNPNPGLVSGRFGDRPVVCYPRFVPDDRWAGRHDEARAWLDAETRDDLLDLVPFFYLRRGRHRLSHPLDGPTRVERTGDEGFTATWGPNEAWSTWNSTLEGAVDEALRQELVLPESERNAWEASHVERGSMLCPTAEEAEIFRMLGETLPLWWEPEKLVEWLRDKGVLA